MLGVEAVGERWATNVIGHHATKLGAGKRARAVVLTRYLEESLHASMTTIVPCLCKTMAARQHGHTVRREPAKRGSRRVVDGLPAERIT